MNKFFYYYNPACSGSNMPTVFANDPYVVAIKDILLNQLQQLVYYIQKLKDLNENMDVYTDKVIEFIYLIIINLDFKKESFYTIFEDLYNNKIKLKREYLLLCEQKGITPEISEVMQDDLTPKDIMIKNYNNIVTADNKITSADINKKFLYGIITELVLNTCGFLFELKNYGINHDSGKNAVLNLLNIINYPDLSDSDIVSVIINFSEYNYKIMKSLYLAVIDTFDGISKVSVPLKTEKGKAILVSGTNLKSLEKILQSVEGTDIKVYTHNGMINAFAFEKLRQYSNLTAHYQYFASNYAKDFANFPGPVYISDNLIPKIDIIKGHIFTSAKYPSFGISKITDNDFSPLINCAANSSGFDKSIFHEEIFAGFDESELNDYLDIIINKINNNEINRIIIIGQSDTFNKKNDYITDLLNSTFKNDFVIYFSFDSPVINTWQADISFNFPMLYKIIEGLKAYTEKINLFFTDCNINTISHIFNIKYLGVKNIFLGQCCPNTMNPVILNGLYDKFDITPLSIPENDLNIYT